MTLSNSFGTSKVQVGLVDPRDARSYRQRFRRDAIPQLNLANSLYVPLGRHQARGWILLVRSDYDLVRGYGTSYQLQIDQFDASAPALTFGNLSIVQARCVTTGILDDPAGLYLVEITDQRGLLKNEWFASPTNSYYNVLSPAYPALYYANSLNLAAPWNWNDFIGDLWNQMPGLGSYTGLPSAPSGVPTNWNLPGVSAWDALCDALEHLGMGVACDLTKSAPYSIVSLGALDAAFDALTAKCLMQNRLEDDLDYIDVGAGRVPGTVVVYFRRVNQYFGTEETVRRDSNQWATNAVYFVSVAAPAFFVGAVGTHHIHDDFPVRYDIDGVPLAADVATAASIAAERVSQYFDLIYSRTSGYMNRTYAGVLPFYAGSQVDGVCWKQDFRQRRAGWTTQVIRGDLWPEVS